MNEFERCELFFKKYPNPIFVFGSNLKGIHGRGAARTALDQYGAIYGKGIGLYGRSYALPTKFDPYVSLQLNEVEKHVENFILFAFQNSMMQFFVTRIGCGLAGFKDKDIAPLFKNAPFNCELPTGWKTYE